jgi:hypothetical protein
MITLTWNVPDPDGAGPCTVATDAMTITVNAPVTANAGPIKLFAVQLPFLLMQMLLPVVTGQVARYI